MSQYHHRALVGVTVQAEQFDGERIPALLDIDGDNTASGAFVLNGTLTINTRTALPDGVLAAQSMPMPVGTWVVLSQAGDVWVVTPDVFPMLYVPVER